MAVDENSTIQDILAELFGLAGSIQRVEDSVGSAAVADLRTLAYNLTLRQQSVEDRLTARETAHHAMVNQLNEVLGQMQVKLKGVLELKPEIMPYDNALAAGYFDETTGIKLRADSTAQRKFTSQLLIMRTAVEYAGLPQDTPVQIWDYTGVVHAVPFPQYIGLMLRFGQWVAAVEAKY